MTHVRCFGGILRYPGARRSSNREGALAADRGNAFVAVNGPDRRRDIRVARIRQGNAARSVGSCAILNQGGEGVGPGWIEQHQAAGGRYPDH